MPPVASSSYWRACVSSARDCPPDAVRRLPAAVRAYLTSRGVGLLDGAPALMSGGPAAGHDVFFSVSSSSADAQHLAAELAAAKSFSVCVGGVRVAVPVAPCSRGPYPLGAVEVSLVGLPCSAGLAVAGAVATVLRCAGYTVTTGPAAELGPSAVVLCERAGLASGRQGGSAVNPSFVRAVVLPPAGDPTLSHLPLQFMCEVVGGPPAVVQSLVSADRPRAARRSAPDVVAAARPPAEPVPPVVAAAARNIPVSGSSGGVSATLVEAVVQRLLAPHLTSLEAALAAVRQACSDAAAAAADARSAAAAAGQPRGAAAAAAAALAHACDTAAARAEAAADRASASAASAAAALAAAQAATSASAQVAQASAAPATATAPTASAPAAAAAFPAGAQPAAPATATAGAVAAEGANPARGPARPATATATVRAATEAAWAADLPALQPMQPTSPAHPPPLAAARPAAAAVVGAAPSAPAPASTAAEVAPPPPSPSGGGWGQESLTRAVREFLQDMGFGSFVTATHGVTLDQAVAAVRAQARGYWRAGAPSRGGAVENADLSVPRGLQRAIFAYYRAVTGEAPPSYSLPSSTPTPPPNMGGRRASRSRPSAPARAPKRRKASPSLSSPVPPSTSAGASRPAGAAPGSNAARTPARAQRRQARRGGRT